VTDVFIHYLADTHRAHDASLVRCHRSAATRPRHACATPQVVLLKDARTDGAGEEKKKKARRARPAGRDVQR
jgi:hypothetical protein